MSTNYLLRNSAVAVLGIAGMTLSACATGDQGSGRYASVYDYESGGSCGSSAACAPAPVVAQPYAEPAPVSPGVVYADCSQYATMDCGTTVYSEPAPAPAPAPTYSYETHTTTSMGAVDCPAGTTMQSDGTCLQSSSSYSTTTTTSTYSSSSSMADCPAGTTMQSDGTCMQSSTYSSTTTYTPSVSEPTVTVCPSGTVMQPDGSCMQSTSTYGYTSSGTYTADDYLPIRK